MKKFLLLGAVFMVTACIGAGPISNIKPLGDNIFPQMEGIDLLGETRVVPTTFAGDLNIVAVAFEREQQKDVNTWIEVAEGMMEENPSLKFYELPVIYEVNGMYRTWINNGMRSGIPSEAARERTITVYTDREKFTSMMDMTTTEISVLLIDDKGKILWRHDGIATKQAVTSLENKIKEQRK